MKAREIGCTGDRCYDSNIVQTPKKQYEAVCTNCGHTHRRHRPLARWKVASCGHCSKGTYNPEYKLEFKKIN